MKDATMENNYLSKLSWILAPLLVILIYSFVFFNGNFTRNKSEYFTLLSHAFLNGHTYLHIASPQVADLSDPYSPKNADIVQQDGGSWHDAAYFKGKYYLYFGPTNAVALMLFHSLGLPTLTDGGLVYLWSIVLALSLAFFCWLFTAKPTANAFFKMDFLPLPIGLLLYFFLTLNLGILCCLARPLFYEAAIACAAAFFWLGCGIALYVVNQKKLSPFLQSLLITAASLAFSFCFFARYTYGTSIFFATGIFLILIYLKERRHLINSARNAFFLITPLSITVILFCYYNYVRFNSISDTGFFYQLTSTTISQPELAAKHLIFSPLYIAINFWQYFLFPYVGAKIPPLYYSGGTVGLLILNHSFLYLGYSTLLYLIAKILLFKRPIFSYKNSQPIISSALIFGILFAIQLLPLLLNMNSEMRYYNDFIYAFYLSIFLFIYFFLRLILIKKNIISYVIYFIFGACIFISISFQLLVSVNYYDALKSGNPTLFNNIILKHEGIISRIYPFNLKK